MLIAKDTYVLTTKFPREELLGLSSQMKRAAVSVASNIAEGSQRGTGKDFAHFLSIAKGSLSELETQFLLARDLSFCTQDEADPIIQKIDELGMMLYVFKGKLVTSH